MFVLIEQAPLPVRLVNFRRNHQSKSFKMKLFRLTERKLYKQNLKKSVFKTEQREAATVWQGRHGERL